MHRYSVAAGGSSVANSSAARDSARSDSAYSATISFGAAPKRGSSQLTAYKLKCDKELLNSRIGPPDFYPPAPDCAEESLTHDTCVIGYKESIPGVEEQREISYSLSANSALWAKDNINRYKESLRKRLRAVTSALIRKRKAGQVYDVPLAGPLLSKPGYFPERHNYGEDFRKKWLEDLSQRKRLSLLADHVPHGFHRRTLFEALVKQNVPFLRATWFIKVLYLNHVQVRSAGNAAGGADKTQTKRLEQWTRDFLDYAQSVLDELCANVSRSSQQQDPAQGLEADADGVAKWHYIVRLLQWQYAEGLLQQSHVADWTIKQIQEKESLDALELLLPVLLEFMDALSLSQVHVRTLVEICLSWLRQLGVSDVLPDPDEQPQQHHVAVTLVELLRYLLVAVPDTFVAFDCFPLLPCVSTLAEGLEPAKEIDSKQGGAEISKSSSRPVHASPYREVFIMEAVDSIQKRASSLSKAVNPGILRNNDGKVIQGLDKWLAAGDVPNAYQTVFDNDFSGFEQLPVEWRNLSSNMPFLSGMMNNVNLSDLFAVRFLCEWAICDFRDSRRGSSRAGKSLASVRDMARIYMTASVLCLKKSELEAAAGFHIRKSKSEGTFYSRKRSPIHQIIVAWIDQHELRKGESMEKMQLLLYELVRKGIFHPDAYVRQLIVEGLLERREAPCDVARAARHRRVLRCLPSLTVDDIKISDEMPENERLYRNERRLALQSFVSEEKPVKGRTGFSGKPANVPPRKQDRFKAMKLAEVKQAVCGYLQISDSSAGQQKAPGAPAGNTKRGAASTIGETHGCEECSRAKRQKTSEGKAWTNAGVLAASEPEDAWWVKKVAKVSDPVKLEPSVKPKQNVRGRPKTVRKTQSLAQLHSARVDGSPGASSSHTFDSKVQCPYHRPAAGNKAPLSDSKMKSDLRGIGSALKQLTISEKYSFSAWLESLLRKAFGEAATSVQNQKAGLAAAARWQISDEQFGAVVYMLDTVLDYNALLRFLLWLLPMSGRAAAYNKYTSGVGEAVIVSCLRRYEVVMTSLNLLPEVLTAGMQCASTSISSVPPSKSPVLTYVSELFNKHKALKTVQSWLRTCRVSCDPKLVVELESLKGGDSESGMGFMGMSTSGAEDRDEPLPQRLNSRLARIGLSIKDTVQKGLGEAVQLILTRERDSHTASLPPEKVDECMHRVVVGLLEAIKQNGTAQTDSGLINAAVSALVSNASSAAANAYEDLHTSGSSTAGFSDAPSVRCARKILQLHVRSLCYLKDGLDERQSRVFDVSLASEASAVVSAHLVHMTGRAPRSQFHLSPETPELGALANDFGAAQNLTTSGRAAAASALVVMTILQGAVSLERLITVLKIKDGLDALHLPKLHPGTSNGLSRGAALGSHLKSDNLVEAHIHWFRTLLGDCRAVVGGLVGDFLGDASMLALARTQRLLSLSTVFPSGYAMFCGLLRRQVLSRMNIATRDDSILHSLSGAVADIVKHEPFQEVCLQDTKTLYNLLSTDGGTADYAALLDEQVVVLRSKIEAILPFSARLFLHALLDAAVPPSMQWHDEGAWMMDAQVYEQKRQVEQMVHILDELQPATFHWQWLELRLLLNEQVFVEKIEAQSTAVAALQASVGASDQLSECEKVFTENILTGLLYRPDAGALYSEVLHSLGKPLEEYVIKLVKWTLQGSDVLFGRKSLRQRLELNKGISKGTSGLKSWGWQPPGGAPEVASPEEGEVSQDNTSGKAAAVSSRDDGICLSQHFATEKALADLVLPCLARSLHETCSNFALDLVNQIAELEQQVTVLTRSSGRLPAPSAPVDAPGAKNQSSRRGARVGLEGGSPGVRRRSAADSSPVSAGALQSSMWLRLQFLLPLLRIIYCDREHPSRNMRLTLAPVLLRLLGSRIVQESAESFGIHHQQHSQSRDGQWNAELASTAAAAAAGEELFDRLLSVLHALLSDTWAVWLKPRGRAAKPPREVPIFDRDVALRMQTELEHMQLPRSLRMRLQAAMPVFPPGPAFSISAAPPQVPSSSFNTLQANLQSSPFPPKSLLTGDLKAKTSPSSDGETWMDPWLLLEDGTSLPGSSSSSAGADGSTLKACPWLKGAVRVRRTDLTYAGSVDSDT